MVCDVFSFILVDGPMDRSTPSKVSFTSSSSTGPLYPHLYFPTNRGCSLLEEKFQGPGKYLYSISSIIASLQNVWIYSLLLISSVSHVNSLIYPGISVNILKAFYYCMTVCLYMYIHRTNLLQIIVITTDM